MVKKTFAIFILDMEGMPLKHQLYSMLPWLQGITIFQKKQTNLSILLHYEFCIRLIAMATKHHLNALYWNITLKILANGFKFWIFCLWLKMVMTDSRNCSRPSVSHPLICEKRLPFYQWLFKTEIVGSVMLNCSDEACAILLHVELIRINYRLNKDKNHYGRDGGNVKRKQ